MTLLMCFGEFGDWGDCVSCDDRDQCRLTAVDAILKEANTMEMKSVSGGVTEGFYQVVARGGMYFVGKVEPCNEGVVLYGPKIVTVNMVEDPQQKRLVPVKNFDIVETRFIPWSSVTCVDKLDTSRMNKNLQEIYTEITGVALA